MVVKTIVLLMTILLVCASIANAEYYCNMRQGCPLFTSEVALATALYHMERKNYGMIEDIFEAGFTQMVDEGTKLSLIERRGNVCIVKIPGTSTLWVILCNTLGAR